MKQVSSLVQKWQTIKQRVEEEMDQSSEEEDAAVMNQRQIEEWKKAQIETYVVL